MFVDKLQETLEESQNVSVTENGAVGYRTTGKALLDLNWRVSSLRRQMMIPLFNYSEKHGMKTQNWQ